MDTFTPVRATSIQLPGLGVASRGSTLPRRGFVDAAEFVAIENRGAAVVMQNEVEARRVGLHFDALGAGGMAGDEQKSFGFVAETGLAVVAHQLGIVTDEDQVRIVIMVVVDPQGAAEGAFIQIGMLDELALGIAIESCSLRGDKAEVR